MNYSRRRLLQISTGAAASSIFSADVFSAVKPAKKLGVALLGLGYYSRDLLGPALSLCEFCELRGIVTGSPEKIPVWQKRYGLSDKNIYSYESMHQLANNPDIDVVYIVTPTSLHKKYALIAANAGKHVWCEKPMAMTVKQCDSIIQACQKNKVQLTVGYRMQHEPNTRTLMSYAKTKPFGKIRSVIAQAGYAGGAPEADNWRLKPEMGGGALYDMGVYPINAVRYATGLEPLSVKATLSSQRQSVFKNVDESADLEFEFEEGITATCKTSVGKNMNILRVECDKGWYELKPMQSYSGVNGKRSDGILLNKTVQNQQAQQMDNDALSIMGKGPLLVPGREGRADIEIVRAALTSHQSNKVVRL